MKTRTNLIALANDYAMSFVASKLRDPDDEFYSESNFIQAAKSKYGVRSRIRLWYWSKVYKGLVDYYMVHIIKSMGKNPIDFIK